MSITRRIPAIDVDIQMTLVVPADAKGPVPVMIMFGNGRMLPGDPPPPGFGGAARLPLARRLAVRRRQQALRRCADAAAPAAAARSACNGAVDCGRLGIRLNQSRQHSGR